MKLVTFKRGDNAQIGLAAADGTLVSLLDAYTLAGIDTQCVPLDMMDIISRYAELEPELARAAASIEKPGVERLPTSDVHWLPPLGNPSKILGVAINDAGVSALASSHPQNPPFFIKVPSALTGHQQPIVIRPDYGLTHPEGELAVVIGRRCKLVKPEDALKMVFGYTILNDVTSVTLKSEDTYTFSRPDIDPPPPGFEHGAMQLAYHARSKNTDTFGPVGPWIVTKDEIANPNALTVKVFMGDEECTTDNTGSLRFTVEEVVSWASRYFTLEPGDIIHMGAAVKGKKYGLRDLDFQSLDGPCSVEISGIGRLSNPIKRIDLAGKPVSAQPRKVLKASWPPRDA
ncbi:2-keto-4-pentenoate hydratase/2-oxohepta-3-ene-1,7-dioic acid hydratase (catechol pathway) [Collimonas sp. OK607]|uniref:fumarylacetoacetate hydrolase family protein n=1 Tax=Collimonas sp. OK607 TaxID=1798194 RepID=UPI0008E015EC|nr:fumarylacetoacetate hydrolase family protein [Collimonas sp. OK607]SFB34602.1 2-keto-4-pentenoate hydratase/2-oxohepta-3-ene-1,7-dioic acid hydratase (catechol pathway) [Collimonas sp. OK607]